MTFGDCWSGPIRGDSLSRQVALELVHLQDTGQIAISTLLVSFTENISTSETLKSTHSHNLTTCDW